MEIPTTSATSSSEKTLGPAICPYIEPQPPVFADYTYIASSAVVTSLYEVLPTALLGDWFVSGA
jgi:hypothetical protein